MLKYQLLLFIAVTCFSAVAAYADSRIVAIWTYYSSPPFSVDNDQRLGLTYDFVDLLNTLSPRNLTFIAHFIPRKRLDVLLKNRNDGIVVWVNPAWFSDKQQQKYLWTAPLMHDTNEVISSIKRSVEFQGAASLKGLQLGGVLGHIYSGLEEDIKKGAIKRFDVSSFHQTLRVLIAGRVDFVIIPKNTIRYLAFDMGVNRLICYSSNPHSRYTRHILVQKGQVDAYRFLAKTIDKLPKNKQWQAILNKYHLYSDPLKPCKPFTNDS